MLQYVTCDDVFLNFTHSLVSDKGRYLLALKRSPLLKMAETFADCQSSVTIHKSRDFWKIAISDEDISLISSLRILGEIMSGSHALFELILLRSFATSSWVTMMSDNGWLGSPLGFAILEESSCVKVKSYCQFRILALSIESACFFPFSIRGATLQLSFRNDFMNDQNLFCFTWFRSFSGHQVQSAYQCVSSMPVFQTSVL